MNGIPSVSLKYPKVSIEKNNNSCDLQSFFHLQLLMYGRSLEKLFC